MFFYYMYSLQRIFELNAKQLILKTLLFLVVFFTIFIGIIIVTAIYMITTKIINP